MKHYFTVGL